MSYLSILKEPRAVLAVAFIAALMLVASDGVVHLLKMWERDEYSHGYFIPLVAIFLLWQKKGVLASCAEPASWWGFVLLLFSLALWALGEAAAMTYFVDYSLWFGFISIALLLAGLRGSASIAGPLFYLFFMIPLPGFLFFRLSEALQLISSELGVAVIRWFDISVYLEGNVIDLGVYQLQVVEACSGLNYLFPLMSFGFLIAYIYRAPLWRRIFVFLSTIPITVLMNSFRIGLIGVTVEYFGIGAAEGVLHDFEGWFVFMACLGVLMLEIWIFYLVLDRNKKFSELLDLDFGRTVSVGSDRELPPLWSPPVITSAVVLAIALPASLMWSEREDRVPERASFTSFPLAIDEWRGYQTEITGQVLDVLKLTDYWIGNFHRGIPTEPPVNFYTAWYASQRKEASIHSPKACLPGGGWSIESHTIKTIDGLPLIDDEELKVNRFVMKNGVARQLVYYWFQGRERRLTDENIAKFYIFWDSLTRSRTDGALVRVITLIPEGTSVELADERLDEYLSTVYPLLPKYIPD